MEQKKNSERERETAPCNLIPFLPSVRFFGLAAAAAQSGVEICAAVVRRAPRVTDETAKMGPAAKTNLFFFTASHIPHLALDTRTPRRGPLQAKCIEPWLY